MALVKCPHCSGEMSDKAKICPHCDSILRPTSYRRNHKSFNFNKRWCIISSLLLMIIVALIIVISSLRGIAQEAPVIVALATLFAFIVSIFFQFQLNRKIIKIIKYIFCIGIIGILSSCVYWVYDVNQRKQDEIEYAQTQALQTKQMVDDVKNKVLTYEISDTYVLVLNTSDSVDYSDEEYPIIFAELDIKESLCGGKKHKKYSVKVKPMWGWSGEKIGRDFYDILDANDETLFSITRDLDKIVK